jgi:hypothetical protein
MALLNKLGRCGHQKSEFPIHTSMCRDLMMMVFPLQILTVERLVGQVLNAFLEGKVVADPCFDRAEAE